MESDDLVTMIHLSEIVIYIGGCHSFFSTSLHWTVENVCVLSLLLSFMTFLKKNIQQKQ